VVQNLLLFAREAKAEKQAVDLADLLERTLSLRAYELKVANIQVAREPAPERLSVWADPHQLQQVFLNLLLNAEQAIRSQRDRGAIRVRLAAADGQAEVQIADDGPGIAPAVLPHIFEPFFTTKPPREGTGLGLSICQAIVKEHGGEIGVESAPGAGATFVVRLPRHRVEASRGLGSAAAVAPVPAPGEKNGWRILVVDDEPAVARLIADALSQQGYEVRAHTESRRALYEAFEEPFHLVICDIRMPEVDGPAFYRALRDRESGLVGRLLFTTGDTLAQETADFLAEARLPFLAKPFRVEELRRRVRELLADLDKPSAGNGTAPAPGRAPRKTGRSKGD
jgi:two-component system NtrC family sensor kinase